MAAITYDELVRSVPIWSYATNRELVAEMPRIIADAEDELWLSIDHDLFQAVITGSVIGPPPSPTPGVDYSILDLGSVTPRIMELRAIRLAYRGQFDWVPIERRELEYLSMLYSRNNPARPRFYANYGGTLKFKVFPYPREEYDLELTANVRPLSLSAIVQTNQLTTDFPRAVEKACLRQAALFMKDAEGAATYLQEMNDALGEANMQMARRRRDETGQRPVETANASGR